MVGKLAPSLSVVIIARNEADRIRECIESVFSACDALEKYEIILVDSNSSDQTVAIATEYPITVLRIPSDDLATPGAGRYVGSRYASGDFVLFVDGDLHVADGWINDAIRTVEQNGSVVGVDGYLAVRKRIVDQDKDVTEVEGSSADEERRRLLVTHVRGIALYDKEVLESVGGFDPWLESLEDVDLGYRLTHAGYDLVRLPLVVGSESVSYGFGEILRRWRNGYPLGEGQVVRKSLDEPGLLVKWISRFRKPIATMGWLALGGLLAGTFQIGLLAWITVSVAGITTMSAIRGPLLTAHTVISYVYFPLGIAFGFVRYPSDRGEYPIDRVEVVKREDVRI